MEPENNVVFKDPCHKICLLSESHEIGANHNISDDGNQTKFFLQKRVKCNEERNLNTRGEKVSAAWFIGDWTSPAKLKTVLVF